MQLEPCPFCGLDVTDDEGCYPLLNEWRPCWEVRCGNPSCYAHEPCDDSRQAAVSRWNRRANVAHATAARDAEIAALMECNRSLMDALNVAELSNEALREEVDGWKRVAATQAELHDEAEARAERLAEALRAERRWWVDRKADAIREQVGGLTRGDPGAIARCDAAIQRIDAALDQETTNG